MSKRYKIKIFWALAKDTRLSLIEKLVAAFIYTLDYADKKCTANDKYISNQLTIPKRAVEKAIMNLETYCLIEDLRDDPTSYQILVCNKSICKKGYFKLSVELLESDLDISTIFLYGYISTFNTSERTCFSTSKTIGESLGLTICEVKKGLKELKNIGWLKIFEKKESTRELKILI